MMTPTSAYSLLTPPEKLIVDEYVSYVIMTQRQKRERIALALNYPIPSEFTMRSRGLILKPIPRAALTERIKEEAQKQDLSPDTLIQEYYNLAYSNMADYVTKGNYGEVSVKPLETIPREKLAAIKRVTSRMTTKGIETIVEMHDKRGAMDVLAKLMGMVHNDGAPLLEDYATNNKQHNQMLLDAPEDIYASMIDG